MLIKNARFYQFKEKPQFDLETLTEQLSEKALQPCDSHAMRSIGWVSPFGKEGDMIYSAQGSILLVLAVQEKIMPPAVIKETVDERVAEIQASEGRRCKKNEINNIKDDIIAMMLPKAFAKTSRIKAYIDTVNQLLVVDTTSAKMADLFIDALSDTLERLPVVLSEVENASSVMTTWVSANDYPLAFTVLDQCTLKSDTGEGTATIRCNGHDVLGDNIRAFVNEGGVISDLALNYKDQVDFILTEELVIKSIKYSDLVKTSREEHSLETEADQLAADFIIATQTISPLIKNLIEVFDCQVELQPESAATASKTKAPLFDGEDDSDTSDTVDDNATEALVSEDKVETQDHNVKQTEDETV